jgi:ATP-dependent DNA ligase
MREWIEHVEPEGATVFDHACRMGLEGIVLKATRFPLPLRPHQELDQSQKS